jgi:putative endonuclease
MAVSTGPLRTPDAARRITHNCDMPSYVYVLGCRVSGRTLTYVGWTTDVRRRLARHNSGAGARFTRGRMWVLLHIERFRTRRQAMRREWQLKRDRKFRKILSRDIWAPRNV